MRAAPVVAGESDGVRIVHHDERVVLVGEVADRFQIGEDPVHGEDAVGGNEPDAGAFRLREPGRQIRHVVVGVAQPLRLGQPHAVDDAGVIERVADHRVGFVEHRFEQSAVRVEARRIKDGVFRAEEARDPRLQLLVHVLRSADEADRSHPVTMPIERGLRCLDDARVVGQSQIVVRAEIQDGATALHADDRSLRTLDDPLALEEALLVQRFGLSMQMLEVGTAIHGALK